MPGLFFHGETIADSSATVSGGMAIMVETKEELDVLCGLCLQVYLEPRGAIASELSYERAFRELFGRLITDVGALAVPPQFAPEDSTHIDKLLETLHTPAWNKGRLDPFETLIVALAGLSEIWEETRLSDSGEVLQLNFVLALASPTHSSPAEVEIRFEPPRAALEVKLGSLFAGISVVALIKGTCWVGAVVARGAKLVWRRPAAAADALVNGAREQAQITARHAFPRLDQLTSEEEARLREAQLVVVLLHGLLSTDLGTFDGFLDRLFTTNPLVLKRSLTEKSTQDPNTAALVGHVLATLDERLDAINSDAVAQSAAADFGQDASNSKLRSLIDKEIAIVGWPHNTLTSIDTNGGELADTIGRIFKATGPQLIFVCHSRGGLVARATAKALLQVPESCWGGVLVDCYTFGTPHTGAPIAQYPARELAIYLLLLRSSGRATSLLDVLVYLDANTAEGIEQLGPPEVTTEARELSYLSRLFEDERKLAGSQQMRVPPIVAIGGEVTPEIMSTWRKRRAAAFLNFQMGTSRHDLLVPLTSSTSERVDPDIVVTTFSDHFGYFSTDNPSETGKLYFDLLLGRIWSRIDFVAALRRHAPSAPASGVSFRQSWVSIGGTRIKLRNQK
ncbi:hypothetical protein GOD00_23330 [Sinorhizobium medicae]|nr:hypothetical protein [Sinorhizobium medicae]